MVLRTTSQGAQTDDPRTRTRTELKYVLLIVSVVRTENGLLRVGVRVTGGQCCFLLAHPSLLLPGTGTAQERERDLRETVLGNTCSEEYKKPT